MFKIPLCSPGSAAWLLLGALIASFCSAQTWYPPPPVASPPPVSPGLVDAPAPAYLSSAQLEQILAPIALAGSMLPPRGIIGVAIFSVTIGVVSTLKFPPTTPITTTEIFLCMFGLLVAILLSVLLGVAGLQKEMGRAERSSRRAFARPTSPIGPHRSGRCSLASRSPTS